MPSKLFTKYIFGRCKYSSPTRPLSVCCRCGVSFATIWMPLTRWQSFIAHDLRHAVHLKSRLLFGHNESLDFSWWLWNSASSTDTFATETFGWVLQQAHDVTPSGSSCPGRIPQFHTFNIKTAIISAINGSYFITIVSLWLALSTRDCVYKVLS